MKKIIHVAVLFFLCSIALGQSGPPPPDFEDPNDPNPADVPAVPIDTHLISVSIAALFLGLYFIRRKKQSQF